MANYGDVRLNLEGDWNREYYDDENGNIKWMIGHQNGTAEVHLKADPERRHAFAWVDKYNQDDLDSNRYAGYVFVTKDEWAKVPRWEWDAEGKLYYFGHFLMALPENLFLEREEKTKRFTGRNNPHASRLQDLAERSSMTLTTPEIEHRETPRRGRPRGK